MPLMAGAAAPWFHAPTHARPDYAFSSVAGHYVLMLFLPEEEAARDAAVAAFRRHRELFDERNYLFFGVTRDEAFFNAVDDEYPGVRWFLDSDCRITDLFRLRRDDGGTVGQWVFLDPTLRVIFSADLGQTERCFQIVTKAGSPEDHAGVPMHAPVLIVPRVLEPALCRQLIDYYDADGGEASGVMREVDGKTVPVLDSFKSRRDAHIVDAELQATLRNRIATRLLPEIVKVFHFRVTRMERYIVARYDAKEGGYFKPHRDNTTKGTAHRQFACSINLNSEEFAGGDLRFAEFGQKTYRPPTGGAVIFSCSLLHEATPVTKGTRYAFLPFFYDDAHARIRQQNAQFLQFKEPEAAEAES